MGQPRLPACLKLFEWYIKYLLVTEIEFSETELKLMKYVHILSKSYVRSDN